MKRLALMVVACLMVLSANGSINAEEWTWADSVVIVPPVPLEVVEVAADESSGTVYALDEIGNVSIIDPETGGLTPLTGGADGAKDIAVDPSGQLYICTADSIKYYEGGVFKQLDPQPVLPDCPEGEFVSGTFISITVGEDGKLYLVYEVVCSIDGVTPIDVKHQYIITAEPPLITEGVVVDINPNTLNLRSQGRWVSCRIDLPEGLDESTIDINTVLITKISVNGSDYELPEPIEVPAGSPSNILYDGSLMVKFIRYDKGWPRNPQSLAHTIWTLLNGEPAGFYQANITVKGQVNGQYFEGSDTIKLKKPKKGPKGY